MDKKVAIIITPNWRDYGEKYLPDFVPSLRAQDYERGMKFFITDNESSDESLSMLKKFVPEAAIAINKTNDGFAKGVNDAIRLALKKSFDYYIIFNIDTVLDKSCVREMIKATYTDKVIGIVQARVMLYQNKEKINSLGNTSHFLGFGYSLGYKEKFEIRNSKFEIKNIHYPSGVAILFTHEFVERIGIFDEEYWMYNEDQEIGWRAWLAGYRCVLAPKAVIYHKYEFTKSIKQYYWMDRNRIISMLICYKIATLLLIFPAFVIMELGLILFSISGGWFKDKMRVWQYFLCPRTWKYICKARKRNQALRKVKDKEIVKLITGRIWYQEIDDWKLRLVNPVFSLYGRIIRSLIFW
ncbi:glycosyltransferase family 2 protein [Candidatus Parcubacteria bacterium]|nr:glycosyltransferase family 2 protein [Candidatus Parcubacteria bacterium]